MGTFAEVLSEAIEREARSEGPLCAPFADAVRVIEEHVADAVVMWARPAGRHLSAVAPCARYATRVVARPLRSIDVAA